MATLALFSMASLWAGGRAAACAAALVRANASLASCTLTGGSGLTAKSGVHVATGRAAAPGPGGLAESVSSFAIFEVMRSCCCSCLEQCRLERTCSLSRSLTDEKLIIAAKLKSKHRSKQHLIALAVFLHALRL